MSESVHSGHRGRMRERYLRTGFDGFQPHEVLELLLFYGIPRKDTNALAHQLIARFGSLHGVLCADAEALAAVPNMTQNAAVLITMLRGILQYEALEQRAGTELDSFTAVCEYFTDIYAFETREIVRAALLDQKLHVITCEIISEGHPTAAQFSVRRLTELAYQTGCNTLILAHNHPRGSAKISAEDIAVTRRLSEILRQCTISLADHVIVANGEAVSMRQAGVFLGLETE